MLKVRKDDPRKFKSIRAKAGVPPEQLKHVKVIKKSTDREKFQWKMIFPNGKVIQFSNFKQVKFYVNQNLSNSKVFLEIQKENGLRRVDFSTFQKEENAGCIC